NFDLWKRAAGGRHQIGTMAGFRSEQVAGFLLECMAGFVGIRTKPSIEAIELTYWNVFSHNKILLFIN
ncbi:MAG: hypothetical protein ACLPIG_13265, partial [Methylocella sp.]